MKSPEQLERLWHANEQALAEREISDRVREKTCIPGLPGLPVPAPGPARERMDALEGRAGRTTTSDKKALDAQLLEELAGLDAAPIRIKEVSMTATTTAPVQESPAPPGRLARISKGKQPEPQRTMIYGIPGVGKSTFGSMAPAAVFIQTEDGLGHLDVAKFPLSTSFGDVIQAITDLYQEAHDYRTVVLDSLDWLERLIHQEVCREQRVANIEDIGYGKGYAFALTHWRRILMGLDALRNERGMQVVVVAHSAIEKFSDPTNESYDRYTPRMHKSANAVVQEWADNILFATMKVLVRTNKQAFGATEVKAIDDGQRVLKCTPRPMYIAKNRLKLPDEIPLDYRHFSHHAYGTPLDA
jgi:hypothetical protein